MAKMDFDWISKINTEPRTQDALRAAYGQSHRVYHTMRHIEDMFGWYVWVAVRAGWKDPARSDSRPRPAMC